MKTEKEATMTKKMTMADVFAKPDAALSAKRARVGLVAFIEREFGAGSVVTWCEETVPVPGVIVVLAAEIDAERVRDAFNAWVSQPMPWGEAVSPAPVPATLSGRELRYVASPGSWR
jgi:hypothetical protein